MSQIEFVAGIERLRIKRRRVLQAAAALAALTASGCATSTLINGAVTDLENMINSFINEASTLVSIPGISSTLVATIEGWIGQLSGLLTGITSTVTGTQTVSVQSALQIIENILEALAPFASVLPVPWSAILPAAEALIPVIAGIFGITITTAAAAPKLAAGRLILIYRPRFQAISGNMSISAAEAVAAQYGKKGLLP